MRLPRGAVGFAPLALWILLAAPPETKAEPFGLTISGSPTDPYDTEIASTGGIRTVYLWMACCQPGEWDGLEVGGLSAGKIGLIEDGPVILSVTAVPPFLLSGPPDDLIFGVGGCPNDPILIASISIFAFPGTICFGPAGSEAPYLNDCTVTARHVPFGWTGLGVGTPSCTDGVLCGGSYRLEKTAFAAGTVVREGGGYRMLGTVAEWGITGSVHTSGSYTLTEGYWEPVRNLVATDAPGRAAGAVEFANAVFQSYPNPFQDATTVAFTVSRPGRVRLGVYDVAGRRVARVLDEPREAGRHIVRWNGRNESGHAVASGVYFYRLEIGDWRGTRRMLKVR